LFLCVYSLASQNKILPNSLATIFDSLARALSRFKFLRESGNVFVSRRLREAKLVRLKACQRKFQDVAVIRGLGENPVFKTRVTTLVNEEQRPSGRRDHFKHQREDRLCGLQGFNRRRGLVSNKSNKSGKNLLNYKALTNDELVSKTEKTIQVERESTTEVIRLFEEIQSRRLYLKYGFPSLFEMATKHFGYCAASAMRRINAMRLIKDVPEAFEKIESGELSLSVVNELQTYFQQEKKAERPYSVGAKIELVEASLGKSRRDVEREIANRNPEQAKRETVYAVSHDRLRMNISISKELLDRMNHLRDLRSHSSPNMTIEELLAELVELGLEKHDPDRKDARRAARLEKREKKIEAQSERKPAAGSDTKSAVKPDAERQLLKVSSVQVEKPTSSGERLVCASNVQAMSAESSNAEDPALLSERLIRESGVQASGIKNSRADQSVSAGEHFKYDPIDAHLLPPAEVKFRTRYIPVSERPKREPCCAVDEMTGRRCNSTKFLQLDHIIPFAYGGKNTKENLRWLCGEHNRARVL
jgi:hypothetical protein